jgi:hypothetical protein
MGFHTTDTPDSTVGMHDPVSAHIPLKVEEKIWRGEYIHFGVLFKSAKELASDSMLDRDLVLKRGTITVVNKKSISGRGVSKAKTNLFSFQSRTMHIRKKMQI